jgi:hypothetical protein
LSYDARPCGRRHIAAGRARHDDQVDALGLVGQLLDRITAGQNPKPPDKQIDPYRMDGYREMFDETRDWGFKLL